MGASRRSQERAGVLLLMEGNVYLPCPLRPRGSLSRSRGRSGMAADGRAVRGLGEVCPLPGRAMTAGAHKGGGSA